MQVRQIAPRALLVAAVACGGGSVTPQAAPGPARPPPPAPGSGFSISAALQIDKTTVSAGGTVTGTVTYQNTSASSITIASVAIAARPPGGTHVGGPFADLQPALGSSIVLPGATLALTASRTFTAADPAGQWETYSTYQDSAGVYHDGPSLFFTVSAPPTPAAAPAAATSSGVSDWDPSQIVAATVT